MENQEAQQAAISVVEFDNMKNELGNLAHWCLKWWADSRISLFTQPHKTQGLLPVSQSEVSMSRLKACRLPLLRSTFHNLHPNVAIPEIPQHKKKISAAVDKETKDKVDELERRLKQIKGKDSLRSSNFNDLYSP